jgi:hypothetical protein
MPIEARRHPAIPEAELFQAITITRLLCEREEASESQPPPNFDDMPMRVSGVDVRHSSANTVRAVIGLSLAQRTIGERVSQSRGSLSCLAFLSIPAQCPGSTVGRLMWFADPKVGRYLGRPQ